MKIYEITESREKLDEFAWLIPLAIAGARVALPWAARVGARLVVGGARAAPAAVGTASRLGTSIGAAGAGIGIGAAGLAVKDVVDMTKEDLVPLIASAFGSEAVQKVISFAGSYGLPILVAVAILYGGAKILNYLANKAPEKEKTESYKQTDGDYARGNAPMPKKKRRGPHPLGGKLVGGEGLEENASAGSTSSAAMATVINPISANHKPSKHGKYGAPVAPQKLNKNGTVKNALDMTNNIMGGKPIKR